MSFELNVNHVLNNALHRAVESAVQGNLLHANGLISSLGLTKGQEERILSILKEVNLNNALTLEGRISIIAHENDEMQPVHEIEGQPLSPSELRFFDLPKDNILTIFFFLRMEDLFSCQLVCQYFNCAIRDDSLCKAIFNRDFLLGYPRQDFSLGSYNACKDAYTSRFNLHQGVCAQQAFEKNKGIFGVPIFFDGRLFSPFTDHAIKILDLDTDVCSTPLKGHEGVINCLAVDKERLYSGSYDNTIKIWDIEKGICLHTLKGHGNSIASLCVSGKKLCSSSWDRKIKIWDIEEGTCLNTFDLQDDFSSFLTVVNGKLCSSRFDGKFGIRDLETGACSTSAEGHKSVISSFAVVGKNLCSSSHGGEIKIWDVDAGECLKILTIEGGLPGVLSLSVVDGYLFSGHSDGTIRIWDVDTGVCLNTLTLEGHQDPVVSLTASGKKLYVGFQDGRIEVLGFQTKHTEVFTEIADLLDSGDEKAVKRAMERFSKMPKAARREIYRNLNPSSDLIGIEQAFDEDCWLKSTPEEKALAIRRYLELQGANQHSL